MQFPTCFGKEVDGLIDRQISLRLRIQSYSNFFLFPNQGAAAIVQFNFYSSIKG